MDIPTSLMGYKKDAVNEIIKQKDNKLIAQQKDIDYLRKQISALEKSSKSAQKNQQKDAKKIK